MAPVMVREAEREDRQAVSRRHRVLIAAAVAAVVGGRFRILAIDPARTPAGWKHTGRIPPPAGPVVRRPQLEIPTQTPGEEETDAPSNHA